ncbi:MAG TPA: DnaB-like helicase C-terminal domain-containing protein, partial [Gemmatimonadaceae bacterium]|nr:DnaB-like helicase C-terminal domain-containing protein [Gemmatimonadaceae bacterium]
RTLRGAPLTVLDQPGATLAAVRAEARRIVARHGRIGLVVLDYLQLMTPPERRKGGTREEEVSQLSRGAKILAGELGCAVLALSQLNRAADGTAPRLAHLRESGALEQDANAVIFLHSDVAPQEGDAVIGVDVIVAKNRSGPVGKVSTLFGRAITTFTEQRFDGPTEEDL